jgi:conjugal transfer pilus assembly protein TraU
MEGYIPRYGVTMGFNEVIRYIEVVKDPYCMPSLGMQMTDTGGLYGGTGSVDLTRNAGGLSYYQTHYAIFLPFMLMNMFTDLICVQDGAVGNPFTIAYLSELEGVADGSNSSSVAAMLNPETTLFANPAISTYCMGDAVLTAAEFSDIAGFWCVGGHVLYPLSNFEDQGVDYIDAASIVAAKVVYKMVRFGSLLECMTYQGVCKCFPVPMWNKMTYRFQMAKPVSDNLCRRMGKPYMLWGEYPAKNPPYIASNDNLLFLLWRHRECCAF